MFYLDTVNGKKIVRSDLITEAENFFTTRECCIFSKDNDFHDELDKNRLEIEHYLGQKMATYGPEHGNNIAKVQKDKYFYPKADGLLLENSGSAYLSVADCVPLIFYCKNVGILVHAGWRGTVQKIAKCAVDIFVKSYDFNPQDIKVVIGPAICMNCYEVSKDVYDELYKTVSKHDDGFKITKNKYFIGLKNVNKQQLIECGVQQIDVCPYCTACGEKLFFSYRYENHIPLRLSAVLKIG